MINRYNAERSITQLLSLILGGPKSRASAHLSHNLSERLEFCFKLVQQDMQQAVKQTDPEALEKALSDGQRQLSSLQSLKTLTQLINEVEW